MISILKIFDDLVFSVSATTRNRREVEVDGKDYFFITEEEFERKIDNKEFIEWERFYDYNYGTLRSFVDDKIAKGLSVVLEVDVKGAINIKKNYPQAILIYIAPPSMEELKERLINRKTETKEDLEKRIKRAEMEIQFQDKFDYVVVNNKLEDAVEEVKKVILSEIDKKEI